MKKQWAATVTSLACTVHCMATPLVLAAGAHSPAVLPEWGGDFLIFAVMPAIAVYLLVRDFRQHRKASPLWIWVAGFAASIAAHLADHAFHTPLSLLAAGLMLGAFYHNHRQVRCCVVGHAH